MKFRVTGLDKYVRRIENISNPFVAQAYMEKAITEGAKIVENETMHQLRNLPTDDRKTVPDGEKRKGLRSVQKSALISSFGTSKFETRNDFLNRKTGVDNGLNKLGQPHVVVARMLENGTSWMKKDPVFSRASRKARKECIEVMAETLRKAYAELMR